jgi:hypothetical protein
MRIAVRQAIRALLTTERKLRCQGIADRPFALVVSQLFDGIDDDSVIAESVRNRIALMLIFDGLPITRVVCVLAFRQAPETKAMNLSDHGVSGTETENPGDLLSRLPLKPELLEKLDLLFCPSVLALTHSKSPKYRIALTLIIRKSDGMSPLIA